MALVSPQEAQLMTKDGRPLIGPASTTVASVATTGTTQTSPYGFTTAAQGDNLVAAVNSILTCLKDHGFMKSA
jgi:hypothetical protein